MIPPHLAPHLQQALNATGVSFDVFARNPFGFLYRSARAVQGREAVWAWLKENSILSLPDISEATGGKRENHWSVLAAMRRVKARRAALAAAISTAPKGDGR